MSNFRPVDRETGFLLPPSVEEWLPERHLARFVVEVIEQLDLSAFVKAYRGSGSASYHPSMLLGLLVYGYATGVFSSRKLERATYDSVAFRFIAANDHPDHDTIAAFRRRFLDRIAGLFVEVLLLAREAGVLKLGTVALDGTKVHANASRHSALSWKHACELEARLKAEVAELMALAEAADGADVPDGMSVPEELARREDRLARIAEAKAVIEARARERLERERAESEAKLEARAEKAEKTGRKPGGRPPEPPVAGPGPKDQVNLTDADSRIMPVAGGGFEQAYNAQALVAADSLLVVTNDVVQAPNDKRQIEPALEALARLPEALGAVEGFRRWWDAITAEGIRFHEAQPPLGPAPAEGQAKRRGRKPRRTGHNLLLRLQARKEDALRFLANLAVPFTNNQAEQDVRMAKLKQKISGGFRSEQGANDFATIRGFISTAKKQGWNIIPKLMENPETLIARLRDA